MIVTDDRESNNKIFTLANWIKKSNYTVIFTGAGMSTESGIPDFRSKEGLWRGVDPMTVATIDVLNRDYETFYEFYRERIKNLEKGKPHKGYEILSRWEKDGILNSISTQNVDGFHKLSGNKNVYELHGSINSFGCSRCRSSAEKKDFLEISLCKSCDGPLRPNIVLFGEALPQDALYHATKEMEKAELVIVIGTSLAVYPVNMLPSMTRGKKVYINKEVSVEGGFDLIIRGMAGEILQDVDNLL